MKRLFRIALAICLFAVLISIFVLTIAVSYNEFTQIDVHSGMLRTGNSFLGFGFNKSQPIQTELSLALNERSQHSDWLTVRRIRPYSPIKMLINYDYIKLLSRVQCIQRVLNNDRLTEVFAILTIEELAAHRDVSATRKHLDRVWDVIWNDYPEWRESLTERKIHDLWRIKETEQIMDVNLPFAPHPPTKSPQ